MAIIIFIFKNSDQNNIFKKPGPTVSSFLASIQKIFKCTEVHWKLPHESEPKQLGFDEKPKSKRDRTNNKSLLFLKCS
jgi:hypothetical protein